MRLYNERKYRLLKINYGENTFFLREAVAHLNITKKTCFLLSFEFLKILDYKNPI